MDFLYLGTAPPEEDCAQTTDDDFTYRNKRECVAWKHQLARVLSAHVRQLCRAGEDMAGVIVTVAIKTENHSYGATREVVVKFNDNDLRAVTLAYWLEANLPPNWDLPALAQMAAMTPRKGYDG